MNVRDVWKERNALLTPVPVAIAMNLLVLLLVAVAVFLYLRGQREQVHLQVQARIAALAHAQALLVNDDFHHYENLLSQLEKRLNALRILEPSKPASVNRLRSEQDLLREFLSLLPHATDLLLLRPDGTVTAASEVLQSRQSMAEFCPVLEPLVPEAKAGLSVVENQGPGRCPPAFSLVYRRPMQRALEPGLALWMLIDAEHFRSPLSQELGALPGRPLFRVIQGSQSLILGPGLQAIDAQRWGLSSQSAALAVLPGAQASAWYDPFTQIEYGGVQVPIPGTGMQVQVVYRLEEALAPWWGPVQRLWSLLALGFVLIWWLVSFLVVRLIRHHDAELKEREQRFDMSLDFARSGVWDLDVASGRLYGSKHLPPIFGLRMGTLSTTVEQLLMTVHAMDRRMVEQALERGIHHGEPYNVQHRVVWPDGSVHWIHGTGDVLRDAHGRVVRMLGVLHDITEQRAAQAHQRMLETVVSELNDIVYIIEAQEFAPRQRRIVFVNEAMVRTTGYSRAELLSQTTNIFYGPNTEVRAVQRIFDSLETGRALRLELATYMRDRRELWMDVNMQPIYDPDGALTHWVIVARDVTERRRAQDALLESERRLSGVIESAMDAIISVDEQHRIILFNSGAHRMFGYRADEMMGQPIDALLPAHLRDAHHRHMRNYHSDQRERVANRIMGPPGPLTALRRDGQEFPIEASISRVAVGGRMILTVIVRDITERRESERRLWELNETLEMRVQSRTRELQKALHTAEQAKQIRGEFLAKMSHEMRTPMNAMLGLTYLALRSGPSARVEDFLQKIRRSGEHLLGTINDILDFSKIDAGKLELAVDVFDLRRMLEAVLQMSEVRAQEKQLELRLELSPDAPAYVMGDPLRLQQVLINFVNNAIKFTHVGHVTLRVSVPGVDAGVKAEAEAGAEAGAGTAAPADASAQVPLHFEVEDTGIGLNESDLTRLFESFEQADNSTTRRYGGTGLGLAISRQLARLMGGEVGVRSQIGQGSVFWLDVPLGRVDNWQAPTPVDAGGLPDVVHHKRVLVVDDNELNLEVALGILQQWGVQTLRASDGAQALQVLQEMPVDLVLMDMHMPVMDGLQATRALREQSAFDAMPVVAMTANARPQDHALCLEAGMDAVIVKPFAPDRLLQLLRNLLGSPQQARRRAPLAMSSLDPGSPLPLTASPQTEVVSPAPAATPQTPPSGLLPVVLDAGRLATYVGSDASMQLRFIGKFENAVSEFMGDLPQGLAADWKAVAELAHKVKSSARTVGALQLAHFCESLEHAGRAGESERCAELIPQLQQAHAQTTQALEQQRLHLQGLQSAASSTA